MAGDSVFAACVVSDCGVEPDVVGFVALLVPGCCAGTGVVAAVVGAAGAGAGGCVGGVAEAAAGVAVFTALACACGAGAGGGGTWVDALAAGVGVETTERAPFTTPTEPKPAPSLPNPAYDDGNAVNPAVLAGAAGAGAAAGVGWLGTTGGGVLIGAVDVAEVLSGAMPAIPSSYPERASR